MTVSAMPKTASESMCVAPYIVPTVPQPNDSYDYTPNSNWIQIVSNAPPRLKALNGVILCQPFTTNAVQKKQRSGFATISQKVSLTPLIVLVGNAEIPAGYTVYVRAEACQSGWGKEVFESDLVPQFIRVPLTDVVFVKDNAYLTNTWTLTSNG